MPEKQKPPDKRFHRDTPEFNRIISLSDAVFAIAMTLLVLTIDIPAVPAGQLAAELAGIVPQIIAFLLSFALVAHIWWEHHSFIRQLSALEPVLVLFNLILLCGVALVPFTANLVGNTPNAQAAVLPFIGQFIFLSLLYWLMSMRAFSCNLFSSPIPESLRYNMLAEFLMGIVIVIIAFVLAIWWPVVGLIIIGAGIVLGPLASRLSEAQRYKLINKAVESEQKPEE